MPGRARAEDVLEPDLPIIDAHHHLHDHGPPAPAPHGGASASPRGSGQPRRYLLEDVLHDIAECGHNVRATVFVQSGAFYRAVGHCPENMRAVGETEHVQGIAAACQPHAQHAHHAPQTTPTPLVAAAIVGSCDLRDPGIDAVLQAHMASRNFRGVRMVRRRHTPVPRGGGDVAFRRGMQAMARHGLVYDVWQTSPAEHDFGSVRRVVALAREFADVTIVLNHLGTAVGPLMTAEDVQTWRGDLADLATCANVFLKVGGIHMPVNGWGLDEREAGVGSEELLELVWPFYRHAIGCFGPQRCMVESNFPVDKQCVSMRVLYNTLKLAAARLGLSRADRVDLFHDTAARVYGLPLAAAAAAARAQPGSKM